MGQKITEALAVVACIDPDAYGTGAQTSDWIDMSKFERVAFIVQAGTLGSSATLDFKVQQSKLANGSSPADISGKAITQLTEAGTDSDKQVVVSVEASELSDGYRYIAGLMTVGVASSDAGVVAVAMNPNYGPVSDYDLASVAELVA
ncbi:MAG: hypothetical protein LC131_02900 [Anaerolineae bacterium]|nr:hypothetical protein [Anaerolineae bacterium]